METIITIGGIVLAVVTFITECIIIALPFRMVALLNSIHKEIRALRAETQGVKKELASIKASNYASKFGTVVED